MGIAAVVVVVIIVVVVFVLLESACVFCVFFFVGVFGLKGFCEGGGRVGRTAKRAGWGR